jgi:hypothetical protein
MANFHNLFDTLTAEQKSEFLLKALTNSESLQNQLVLYFGNPAPRPPKPEKSFAARVEQSSARAVKKLENIDLDELDYSSIHSSGRYYDRWEVESEMAEEEIVKVMSQLAADCIGLIEKGDIEAFIVEFTGCLNAIVRTEIDDPNEILGDPKDHLHQEFRQLTNDCVAALKSIILNPESVSHAISMVLQWFKNDNHSNVSADYHDLLCSNLIRQHGGSSSGLTELSSGLPDLLTSFPKTYIIMLRQADPALWLTESERLARFSPDIGSDLLDYLFEHNIQSFYKIAPAIFDHYPQSLVNTMATRIDPDKDRDFALKVWEYKVTHQKKLNDYKVLAKLFADPARKEVILKRLEKSGDYEFYVKVLTHEKMYDRILALASGKSSYYYDLKVILTPIVNIYPAECFRLAKQKVAAEMQSNKVSRSNYERIASLLKIVDGNPDLKPEVRIFVRELVHDNSRRSALRQELASAGLF